MAQNENYEIKSYDAANKIQTYAEGFMKLSGYIGVTSAPENEKKEKIAMTTPVLTNNETMQFVLPSNVSDPPAPTNGDVTVISRDAEKAAVVTYYGGWYKNVADAKKKMLLEFAEKDNLKLDADRWEWRRYNPPWTLPWLKKNEIYIPLLLKKI